jgi:hypothetical protein
MQRLLEGSVIAKQYRIDLQSASEYKKLRPKKFQ